MSKSLHLSDLSGFMVTSEDSQSISESDLQAYEQGDGLNWIVTSVNVISHEQVVGLGRLPANTE